MSEKYKPQPETENKEDKINFEAQANFINKLKSENESQFWEKISAYSMGVMAVSITALNIYGRLEGNQTIPLEVRGLAAMMGGGSFYLLNKIKELEAIYRKAKNLNDNDEQ